MENLKWLPSEAILNLRRKERYLNIVANKIRLSILYLLNKINDKLNFNQIANKLKIERNKLAYHISLLKRNHFIDNSTNFDEKTGKAFSYYSITEKGKNIIEIINKMTEDFEDYEKQIEDTL